jgi:hypothetical protein
LRCRDDERRAWRVLRRRGITDYVDCKWICANATTEYWNSG